MAAPKKPPPGTAQSSPLKKEGAKNERRANQPIRDQAQKWFEALRGHLAAGAAQNDITERLKTWATLEDVLADCPPLLPPLLKMAWQLRHQPTFSEWFQTSAGAVAEETSAPLMPCKKSFDEVVLSQLHGAVRLYCLRQEQAWLAAEKARYQPGALEKFPFIAALILRLKKRRDRDILAHYPQRGLYLALKPFLRSPAQFSLIEALATLPTSTVGIFKDATRGLNLDSSIRNLAALEGRKCKFVTDLARVFAETLIENAEATGVSSSGAHIAPVKANRAEIVGGALSQLTRDGLHLAKGAIAVREQAKDIVAKMAVPMQYDMWRVFSDTEGAMSIALCPAVLARALGENAMRVPRRTSEALHTIPDTRVIDAVLLALLASGSKDDVIRWAITPACATAWERLANDFKQAVTQRNEAALTESAIAAYCAQLAPKFIALSTETVPAAVEAPAESAPGMAAAQSAASETV